MNANAGAALVAGGAFGKRMSQGPDCEADLSVLLDKRLREKIGNYERAARKLKVAGQTDAADALVRAASRLRHITLSAA